MDDDEAWKTDFDGSMVAVQNQVANSFWPTVILACELADKGLIDKTNLLNIAEAIIGYVSAEETGSLGEVDETLLPLTHFRDVLEQLQLQPGRVLDELHKLELGAGFLATRRVQNSKR